MKGITGFDMVLKEIMPIVAVILNELSSLLVLSISMGVVNQHDGALKTSQEFIAKLDERQGRFSFCEIAPTDLVDGVNLHNVWNPLFEGIANLLQLTLTRCRGEHIEPVRIPPHRLLHKMEPA